MTEILRRTGSRSLLDNDGKRRSGKRVLARLLWELATTGRAILPDGATLMLSPADWFGVVRFMYSHMEPPKAEVDMTSDGGRIILQVVRDEPKVPDPCTDAAPEARELLQE